MKCPNCDVTLLIADKKDVEIDYCPQCRGIWLDRGELEKIIERNGAHYSSKDNYQATTPPQSYSQQGYNQPSGDYQNRYPHKKKKSFLDDLFDF